MAIQNIWINIKIYNILVLLYLITALTNIFSNDTREYVPKRERSKVYQSLRRIIYKCMVSIEDKISRIQIIMESKYTKVKSYKGSKRRSRRYVRIMAYTVVAMEAKATNKTNVIRFNTDSAPVGIDNQCTGCISHVAQDFIGQLQDSGKSIKGFGGTRTSNVKIGTLLWR